MNEKDPYAAPGAVVNDPVDPANPTRWKRIVAWGALICAVMVAIYILSGIVDTKIKFYGITIEEITAAMASFVLYLVFLHATPRRHFLQLMCVFLAVQVFGIVAGGALDLFLRLAIGDPFDALISFAESGRSLLVCLLAYAVWYPKTRKVADHNIAK